MQVSRPLTSFSASASSSGVSEGQHLQIHAAVAFVLFYALPIPVALFHTLDVLHVLYFFRVAFEPSVQHVVSHATRYGGQGCSQDGHNPH